MSRLCSRLTARQPTSPPTTNPNNPYSKFKYLCINVRTKEHAQLVGIVSLSVFVCMIVVSYALFGALAVAYIACGIIIYGFLMESLLRRPNKIAILGYVAFEALQIAFYLSLAIYILIPLIYASDADWECKRPTKSPNDKGGKTEDDDCNGNPKIIFIEVLIFLTFLIIMKSYFARVMLYLYKYYGWMESHSSDLHASYINNRGVQINMDDNIFPPPPAWTPGLYSAGVNPVPSYDEATTMQKPPLNDSNAQQQERSEPPATLQPQQTTNPAEQSEETVPPANRNIP